MMKNPEDQSCYFEWCNESLYTIQKEAYIKSLYHNLHIMFSFISDKLIKIENNMSNARDLNS